MFQVHERDLKTDFLAMILKSLLRNRPALKIILMSASIDTEKFSRLNYSVKPLF